MVKEISLEQLYVLMGEGAELVDVREDEEYKKGYIPSSKNWPLSSFGMRKAEISIDNPTIFYCSSGLRSVTAAEIASEWTPVEIYSLKGGYLNYCMVKNTELSKSLDIDNKTETMRDRTGFADLQT